MAQHATHYEQVALYTLRLQLVEQIDHRRVGILLETGSDGRDIDEVVGLEDEQFGIDCTVFLSWTDDVELGVLFENWLQGMPVVAV